MSEFTDLKTELTFRQLEYFKKRDDILLAGERLERLKLKQIEFQREHGQASNDLKIAINKQFEMLSVLKNSLEPESELIRAFLREFSNKYGDPQQNIKELSAEFPILLMPLRIETRFKEVKNEVGEIAQQLWVRVYPDNCSIDTFEPNPSESEIEAVQDFWISWWEANGVEDFERGAWRSLVAGIGAGRAEWLIENFRPENLDECPDEDGQSELILVILTTALPEDDLISPTQEYWKTVWIAENGGDPTRLDQAEKQLEADVPNLEKQDRIRSVYRPINYSSASIDRHNIKKVSVTFLVFGNHEDKTQRLAWSKPAKVTTFPERLVLIAYDQDGNPIADKDGKPVSPVLGNPIPSPLMVSPDPFAEEWEREEIAEGLTITKDMKWMFDWDEALDVGMGFKLDLTPDQAKRGLSQLFVLGVRLSADAVEGKQLIQELFCHHHEGNSGFSFLAQGTPTNNTQGLASGHSIFEDSDDCFDRCKILNKPCDPASETKDDAYHFAHLLGLDYEIVKKFHRSDNNDIDEAKAMNTVLWPATFGYFMESMMHPVFDEETIQSTRQFFIDQVLGRGHLPAIRIDSQPYGILPSTRFGGLKESSLFKADSLKQNFYVELHNILIQLDEVWGNLATKTSWIGKEDVDNKHQLLLDILSLHSGSVQFHSRYLHSLEYLSNRRKFTNLPKDNPIWAALLGLYLRFKNLRYLFIPSSSNHLGFISQPSFIKTRSSKEAEIPDILRSFGYLGDEAPEILEKIIQQSFELLQGPLIDDRPLSETTPIRPYTDDGRNYLEWLIKAAEDSLDTLRTEKGFSDNKSPNALLYLFIKHALELGYWDTGLKLWGLQGEQLRFARMEPTFIHIKEHEASRLDEGESIQSESRYYRLYQSNPAISEDVFLANYIPLILGNDDLLKTYQLQTLLLHEQLQALESLKNLPTARLERLFVEHLDCCSYRLDAWRQGFINLVLQQMRQDEKKGLYIGAYGWLENIRPENKRLSDLDTSGFSDELKEIFNLKSEIPVKVDTSNYGFVHAPSLNQAVAAAILRNGYRENATPDNPETLSINLSSDRVRLALSFLEGMRNGQSLAALLGYQLERGLHDRNREAEVDKYIVELRKKFPLVANKIETTKENEEKEREDDNRYQSVEQIEARNVVDGRKLIEHVEKNLEYPYGLGDILPTDEEKEGVIFKEEIDRLRNISDAISDLSIAESVFQLVQGNADRAAGALNTFTEGTTPIEPEIVKTPRSGITLTHRVGIQLNPTASVTPYNDTKPPSPRAIAEPVINSWAENVLPALDRIICKVSWGDKKPQIISAKDLNLYPIDLIYVLNSESDQAMTELDDRIEHYTYSQFKPPLGQSIEIKYHVSTEDKKSREQISFFEVASLVNSLRALVLQSRPLRSSDVVLESEASYENDQSIFIDTSRLGNFFPIIEFASTQLNPLISDLEKQVSSDLKRQELGEQSNTVDTVYGHIEKLIDIQQSLAGFGLPLTGTGFAYEWLNEQAVKTDSTEINKAASAFTVDLLTTATELKSLLEIRIKEATKLLEEAKALAEGDEKANKLLEVYKKMFGETFKVIPYFTLPDQQKAEWERARLQSVKLVSGYFDDQAGQQEEVEMRAELRVDEWLYGIARVREKMHHLEHMILLGETLNEAHVKLEPIQLPNMDNDPWLAMEFQDDFQIDGDRLLYSAHYDYDSPIERDGKFCGLLIDEWTEVIPSRTEKTGLAFHYDKPNSEPPQVMLLALSPDQTGVWDWQNLVEILKESLGEAKKRAVEPDILNIEKTLAPYLPATLSAVAYYPITMSLMLCLNNRVFETGDDDA